MIKRLVALLFLTSVANAGLLDAVNSLDILDAKGEINGRFGQEYFQQDSSISNNITMSVLQGIRFKQAQFVEPYIGFNKAQATYIAGSGNTESVWGGVRVRDFLPPLMFGVEYRSTVEPSNPSIKSVVGYVQFHQGWDLWK